MAHTYYNFNVYFSKKFYHSWFLGKFGPIIWIPSNWLKFLRGIHCYMLITVLILIFSKFFSFIFFGQIWSQNLKFLKLTKIWYRGRLLHAYFDFDVYFFKGFVIHIILVKFGKFQNNMGKFYSILFSPYWRNYIVCISKLSFSKYREQHILVRNFPQKFMNGKYLKN